MRNLVLAGMLVLVAGCERAPNSQAQPMGEASNQPAPPPPALPSDAPSPPASQSAPRLQALGTEPFWSVEVDGKILRYTTPEDQQGTTFAYSEAATANGWTFTAKQADPVAVLTVEKGECSDGMSDTTYPMKATWKMGRLTQSGCARPR